MDTPDHFLARLIQSLAPAGAARTGTEPRRAAITATFQALNPGTGREALFACAGIVMQLAMDDAARRASSPDISPAARARAWAGVMSAGRQMGHWLRQLDIAKKERTKAAPKQAAAPDQPLSGQKASAEPRQAEMSTVARPEIAGPQAGGGQAGGGEAGGGQGGRSGSFKAALLSSTARCRDLPISLGQMITASSRGMPGGGPPRTPGGGPPWKPLPAGSG